MMEHVMLKGAAAEATTARAVYTRWSVLLAVFVVLWGAFFFLHPGALIKVGVPHFRMEVAPQTFRELWFLDTLAILASNDAVAAGKDPYTDNQLDYFRRPHVYGPLWLQLHHLGLTRSDTTGIGLALVVGFGVTILLFLRPGSPQSLLWCILIVCSTPVLMAAERANNDIVVYLLLTPLVPCLQNKRKVVRWLAIPLLALTVALKYYPAVAIILLLANAGSRDVLGRLSAVAIIFALIGWHVFVNVPSLALVPAPAGVFTFGGISVFHELGIHGKAPQILVLVLALVVVVYWWRSSIFHQWHPEMSLQNHWMYFILGSVLLTGCFFVGQHHAYRWIFGIWLAPLLWSLARDSRAPSSVRNLGRVTACLLLVMFWGEVAVVLALHCWAYDWILPALHWITLGMQPFTWAFFICLLAFLVHFARSSLLQAFGTDLPRCNVAVARGD